MGARRLPRLRLPPQAATELVSPTAPARLSEVSLWGGGKRLQTQVGLGAGVWDRAACVPFNKR